MRRSIVILVAILTLLTGCVAKEPVKTNPDVGGPYERITIDRLHNSWNGGDIYIITDNHTGTAYLYINGSGGGIIKLEDAKWDS